MTPAQAIAKSEMIIFDLFHTLVSFKSDGTSGRNTSEVLGIPEEDWNRLLWESSARRLRHNHLDDVSIVRELARQHDPELSEARIIEAAEVRAARFRECLTCPPLDRVQIIRELSERGHKLVLLSNADSMEMRGWQESPFAEHFTAALFSCETGNVKPETSAYQDALRCCGMLSEQAIFVGDGGSDELKGAKVCGIATIMTTEIIGAFWPELLEKRRVDADYTISSLGELLS